jgi:hypothetical protein
VHCIVEADVLRNFQDWHFLWSRCVLTTAAGAKCRWQRGQWRGLLHYTLFFSLSLSDGSLGKVSIVFKMFVIYMFSVCPVYMTKVALSFVSCFDDSCDIFPFHLSPQVFYSLPVCVFWGIKFLTHHSVGRLENRWRVLVWVFFRSFVGGESLCVWLWTKCQCFFWCNNWVHRIAFITNQYTVTCENNYLL